ncbi:MAG: UrcA family protein, partial [Acidobacteriota bacterium]|nr:UrcA family protein [Acidobacteriota bacterium]
GTAVAAPENSGVIPYGDLDTRTHAGVEQLSARVHQAAWDYCLTAAPPTAGPAGIQNVRCQQAVIDEAVAKINNPRLTQMNSGAHAEDTWNSG